MGTKVQMLKEFNGGSMARTFLVNKKGQQYVRKIASMTDSLGGQKLKAQFDWVSLFNRQFPGIMPAVSFFIIDKDYCYYDMEYIPMQTLRDSLISSPGYDSTLFYDALNYGAIIAEVDDTCTANKENYIKEKHLNKMIARCKGIADNDIFKTPYIYVNGKKLKNIQLLIDEISNDESLMRLLKPKKWYRSHGDFTFQNILANDEQIRIIDPRGEGSDSIYYDIGKLYQSCHGKYDLLYEGNFEATGYSSGKITAIDYLIKSNVEKFNNIFEQIRKLVPDYYDVDRHWEIIAKFFEGSHFISMTPFRLKEGNEITLTCYAIGIEILNQVLEEWQNVKS